MIKTISQEHLKEILTYDPSDGTFFWRKKICQKVVVGSEAGTKSRYIQIRIYGRFYAAHALAFLYMRGYLPKRLDHKNRDPYDNSFANLRECTQGQNRANSVKQKRNKAGLKGVCPAHGKWMAQAGGQYLGLFDSPEGAHAAYAAKAKELFGDFARIS